MNTNPMSGFFRNRIEVVTSISPTKINSNLNGRFHPYRTSVFWNFDPGLPPDKAELQRDLPGDFFDAVQLDRKARTKGQ